MNFFLISLLAAIPVDVWFEPGDELPDAIDRIQRSVEVCDSGCVIELGPTRYATSRPVLLCKNIRLLGRGGTLNTASTWIDTSSTAIHVAGRAQCEALGLGGGGAGASIEHLALNGTESNQDPTRRAAGVWMEAPGHLVGVYIDNFTQGVRISAGAGREKGQFNSWHIWPNTNANRWSLTRVRIVNAQHAGLFVDGPDVNAAYALGLDVTAGCKEADQLHELGPCAGAVLSNFLGNTLIAPHFATIKDRRGNNYPAIISDDDNAANTFVGVYSEGLPSMNSKKDVVIGGNISAERPALILQSFNVPGLCFGSVDTFNRVCFGDLAGGAFSLVVNNTNLTLRGKVKEFPGGDWGLRLDLQNLGREQVGRWLFDKDTGGVWFPRETRQMLSPCGASSSTIADGLGRETDEVGTSLCAP